MQLIKGHQDLYRDDETGAVINKNMSGAKAARAARAKVLHDKERLDNLEDDVSKIKNMLQQLLER